MRPAASCFGFVRAVRRRMILLRTLDQVGICLIGGMLVSVVLSPILLARGQSPMPLAGLALCLSLIVGVIALFRNIPTTLDAAMEADRQLRLSDLLSTAISLRDKDEEWNRSIVWLADERCRVLSPSVLILNRLGYRAWAGITVGAALVVSTGLMVSTPTLSIANASNSSFTSPEKLNSPAPAPTAENPEVKAADGNSKRDFPGDNAAEDANGDKSGSAHNPPASKSLGKGGGVSETSSSANPLPIASSAQAAHPTDASTGDASAGGGAAAGDAGSGSSSGIVTPNSALTAPPWNSTDWSVARSYAEHAVSAHQVPDEYRDLIRDYFSP